MSLETAIMIATALLLTLPIGWWVSRRNAAATGSVDGTRLNVGPLGPEARAALVTQLRVIVMRGERRASEAERIVLAAALRELRREGLSPKDVDKLSDVGLHNLWVCERMALGSDAEAAAVLASLPPDARSNWTKIRSKVKREQRNEAGQKAEAEWIASHQETYDRLTVVAKGAGAITRWLSGQTSAVWHSVGLALSPDRVGFGPWLWLSEQSNLDRATAIGLFLKAKPEAALTWRDSDLVGARKEQMKLLCTLGKRLAADRFDQRNLACSGSSRQAYFRAQTKAASEGRKLPWPQLADDALGPVLGREATCDFSVDGTVVRKRVDLAPYLSGQRPA